MSEVSDEGCNSEERSLMELLEKNAINIPDGWRVVGLFTERELMKRHKAGFDGGGEIFHVLGSSSRYRGLVSAQIETGGCSTIVRFFHPGKVEYSASLTREDTEVSDDGRLVLLEKIPEDQTTKSATDVAKKVTGITD